MGDDPEAVQEPRPDGLTPQKHGGALRGPWTHEEAVAAGKKRAQMAEEGSFKARALLEGTLNIAWDDADPLLKGLAENAIKGSSADWRLFMQQAGVLKTQDTKYDGKGPCPTCGQTPGQGLTITADTIEKLHTARRLLGELLKEDADQLLVSSIGTYRARGSGGKDRRPGK